MKAKDFKKLDAYLLDEYFSAKTLAYKYGKKSEEFAKKIKELMEKDGLEKIELHGYSLDYRTKLQPNLELVELLLEKNLFHLLTITCSNENREKICEEMQFFSEEDINKYFSSEGSQTKFLYSKELKQKERKKG